MPPIAPPKLAPICAFCLLLLGSPLAAACPAILPKKLRPDEPILLEIPEPAPNSNDELPASVTPAAPEENFR